MIKQLIIGILFSLSLQGCAVFYGINSGTAQTYHQPQVIDKNYNISGRFVIKNDKRTDYGNFTWQRDNESEQLNFTTPIGNSVARLIIESGTAELKNNSGNTYRGENLDKLLQEQLGFSLPISYLHYWILGVPLPNYPVEAQLKTGFSQMGWEIRYLEWQDANRPKIIQLSKATLQIKLLINW